MRTHLTVVGGGLGGLITAVEARESGLAVTLHEAHAELGGRARTTPGSYRANWGPHVVYNDGPLWAWLDKRGLARPARRAPAVPRTLFRLEGQGRRLPPRRVVTGLAWLRGAKAPIDQTFTQWAGERLGDVTTATQIANLMGVVTFDHAPGRLSAAFVQERLRRVTKLPPRVRYLPGGWATLIERVATHARQLGVRIETHSIVDALPPAPVVLAVPLPRAAALLDDASLAWTGTRTALLDVALRRHRTDCFVVSDLDASGWVEAFSLADPSLAPPGEVLVQAQAGLRPGETLEEGVSRLETLVDLGYTDWRERETWRRHLSISDASGALDLPGSTWRDRPASDRGDGVFVVGDMVAAPGVLSEVAVNSSIEAVRSLTTTVQRQRVA